MYIYCACIKIIIWNYRRVKTVGFSLIAVFTENNIYPIFFVGPKLELHFLCSKKIHRNVYTIIRLSSWVGDQMSLHIPMLFAATRMRTCNKHLVHWNISATSSPNCVPLRFFLWWNARLDLPWHEHNARQGLNVEGFIWFRKHQSTINWPYYALLF